MFISLILEFACDNSVSALPLLVYFAPNAVHMNRLPRLPMTVIEHHQHARGHQGLGRDYFEYIAILLLTSSVVCKS